MGKFHKKISNRLETELNELKKLFDIKYSLNSSFSDYSIEFVHKTTGNKYKVDHANNLDLKSFLQDIIVEQRNRRLDKLLY